MLSSRARYGTRALLDLTLHEGEGPAPIQEIAERQKIPLKFLEQILLSLKRSEFVRSQKGPGGGYLLAMRPAAITLGAVLDNTTFADIADRRQSLEGCSPLPFHYDI